MVRTLEGYRHTAGGKSQLFDARGDLVSITDAQGRTILIDRDKDGPSQGRMRQARFDHDTVYFFYNNSGQVDRIFCPQLDKTVLYRYDGPDLIYSHDASDNRYRYSYDDQHNMTRITYLDGSKMLVSYEDKTFFVSEIVERSGAKTSYEYGPLDGDPDLNYYTAIKYTPPPGKGGLPRYERREFRIRKTETGALVVAGGASEADGIRRELTYDVQGVLKRLVETSDYTQVKAVTAFTFDVAGRVEQVKGGDWIRKVAYTDDPSSTRIKQLSTSYGVEQSGYAFEYDSSGRLITAAHDGTEVTITYLAGDKPEIDSLQSGEHHLRVIRDTEGRVIRLDLEGSDRNGSLGLSYPGSGKPKINTDDPAMAYRISGILSGMLAICAPSQAKVNLEIP